MIDIQDSQNTHVISSDKVSLTDANGKEFIIDKSQINDASTYGRTDFADIANTSTHITPIAAVITDSMGTEMDEHDLISDIKSGNVMALDVTFESTHSNRRINYALYKSESMAEDAHTFMYPFAKPLIKNHDRHEEPLGRVINSEFAPSDFVPGTDTINVTFRVSDNDAMLKFADGRYKTMSIGASAGSITCNTCGKTILADNKLKFCGHMRGETYKDSVCTWSMTKLDYREGSVVNDPADEYAQVKRIKVIRKGDNRVMNENETPVENNTEKTDIENSKEDLISDIDSILNESETNTEEGAEDVKVETAEEQSAETGSEDKSETDNAEDDGKIENSDEQIIENLKAEIEDLKLKSEESLRLKDEEIESLKLEIENLKSEIESLKTDSDAKDSELNTKQRQLSSMASLNKSLLKDSVLALNKGVTDSELENKTARELNDMFKEAVIIANRREIKTLNNPSLASEDNNSIEVNTNTEVKDEKKTDEISTLKDMEQLLSGIFKTY